MALLQTLKSLINERLSVAAEEIFGTIGSIIAKYEDEAFHLKQEIDHQRRLHGWILNPTGKIINLMLINNPEFQSCLI